MSGPLRTSIGPCRARLVGYIVTAQQLRDNPNPPTDQLRTMISRIRGAVNTLETKNREWSQLIVAADQQERIQLQNEYTAFTQADDNTNFIIVLDLGREMLDTLEALLLRFGNTGPDGRTRVRLPQLALPEFDGRVGNWNQFWSAFSASVDSDPSIPEVQKMAYLVGCLKADAERELKGFSVTGPNYALAKAHLTNRFGDADTQKSGLFSELRKLNFQTAKTPDIRKMLTEVTRVLKQLEALGEQINNKATEELVQQKLPEWVLLEVIKQKDTIPNFNTQKLVELVDKILKQRETVWELTRRTPTTSRGHTMNEQTFYGESSRRQGENRARLPCAFCAEPDHTSNRCQKYSNKETRIKRLFELKKCLRCFKDGHVSKNCTRKVECKKCKGSHYVAICAKIDPTENSTKNWGGNVNNSNSWRRNTQTANCAEEEDKEPSQEEQEAVFVEDETFVLDEEVTLAEGSNKVVLMSEKHEFVNRNNGKKCDGITLYDPGSTANFLTEEKARKLDLKPIATSQVTVSGYGGSKTAFDASTVKVYVSGTDGKYYPIICKTSPALTNILVTVAYETNDPTPRIRTRRVKPDLLIGVVDFWRIFERRQQISPLAFCIHTKLGSFNCGEVAIDTPIKSYVYTNSVEHELEGKNTPEKSSPANFWDLEVLGIRESTDATLEDEHREAYDHFNSHIKQLPSGMYEAAWPWKRGVPKLSSNFGRAFGRLVTLCQRNRGEILEKCEAIINEQLTSGIVEDVPCFNSDYFTHYIPYQLVLKKSSSFTKVRMVFDPSTKTREGKTLNQEQHCGPNLIPKIAGVHLRARLPKILLISDIERAFLQISLKKSDRDSTRFIWLKDVSKPPDRENLRILRFTRIPFGFAASPFLLIATVAHHLEKENTPLSRELGANLYMDNMICSADTDGECLDKYKSIKDIFSRAKMNVREFISNSNEVNRKIPEIDRHPGDGKIKFLGIQWDNHSDCYNMTLPQFVFKEFITKRQLLAIIHSIFDPLGLLSPLILEAKMLYQQVCQRNIDWDVQLTAEEMKVWNEIAKAWDGRLFSFPRRVCHGENAELHCFVDASKDAYAAVVYLRTTNDKGEVSCQLIFSKNRIKPLTKPLTIPRLELLAALTGVRAVNFVKEELQMQIQRVIIWSDSQIVLHWINSPPDKKLNRFVKNRLMEIKAAKDVEFRYVPTAENPADISCRGMRPQFLVDNKLWENGPSWISRDSKCWPDILKVETLNEPCEEMVFVSEEEPISVSESPKEHSTIDPNRFSSFWKLVYALMFLLRFCKITLKRKTPESSSIANITASSGPFALKPKIIGRDGKKVIDHQNELPFHSPDVRLAEIILIRDAQRRQPPSDKDRKELQIFEDKEGILRCRSRLQRGPANYAFDNPIYLPKNDPFTRLIVLKIHRELLHAGVAAVLTNFRAKFHMNSARRTIKSTLRECRGQCHTYKKFQLDKMPPYPKCRLEKAPIFSHAGADFMGPFTMKRRGEHTKVWILLITCLVSRAIHMEVVTEMTTTAFLMAFRKFVARRTRPKTIVSDNGGSFQLGQKVLKLLWSNIHDDEEVTTYMAKEGIKWHFNTPLAPWQGGAIERLNGLVKNCFKRALGRKILDEEDFKVFVCEVEAILNCRPIIPVTDDLECPYLRPIDFIYPHAQPGFPDFDADEDESWLPRNAESAEKLVEIWRKKSACINKFWEIWSAEYLHVLRERTPFHRQKNTFDALPKVNEIVIVHDDEQQKGNWKLGRVVEVNSPRKIGVILPNKNVIFRPPSLLYSLEIPAGVSSPVSEEGNLIEAYTHKSRRRNVVQQARKEARRVTWGSRLLVNIVLLLAVLSAFLSNTVGQMPMICPTQETRQYWRIEENLLPCANFTIDPPFPTQQSFDIFSPNLDLVEIEAAHCSIIREKIQYKTDLLNNPHSYTTYTNQSISAEECRRMWKRSICRNGFLLGNPNSRRTQNKPNIEFTYWQMGYRNVTNQNCFFTLTKILAKPGSKALSSPLADITHCRYNDGSCILDDDSLLIWEVNNEDQRFCKYTRTAKWSGNFMGNIWMANNGIFGLAFGQNPPEIPDCSKTLIVSLQDFAVPQPQYALMKSKIIIRGNNGEMRQERGKRSSEYTPKDGTIKGSQLAAELTANQVLSTNATRRAFNHLTSLICSKKSNLAGLGSMMSGIDPVVFARIALNTSYVRAGWVAHNILETQNCLPIPPENITYLPQEKCFTKVAVNVTILDRVIKAFLEANTLILVGNAEKTPCEFARFVSVQIEGKILIIDQLKGKVTQVAGKYIHSLRIGGLEMKERPLLEPHVFYNYIITNYTDPRINTLQMFQAYRLDNKYEHEKLSRETQRGEWDEYVHRSSESFNRWIPLWSGLGLDISWREGWNLACNLYITYLFLIMEALPFIIQRISRYTNFDHYLGQMFRIGDQNHGQLTPGVSPGVNIQNEIVMHQTGERRARIERFFRRAGSVA